MCVNTHASDCLLRVLFRALSCLAWCGVVLWHAAPVACVRMGWVSAILAVSLVPMVALAVSVFQRRIVGTALTKRPVLSLPVSA